MTMPGIIFISGSEKARQADFNKQLAEYFNQIFQDEFAKEETLQTIVETSEFRTLMGIKEFPDHHIKIEVVNKNDDSYVQIMNGVTMHWEFLRKAPFCNFITWLMMFQGRCFVTVDDGIARVKEFLAKRGIAGEIIDYIVVDGTNSEDVASELDVDLDSVIKCLILVSHDGVSVAAIVGGKKKLNTKKLEAASELKKLSMASATVVTGITRYDMRNLPPIAPVGYMKLFIDESLLAKPFVVGSAGTSSVGLKIAPAELLHLGFVPTKLT
jgi:prolyl-tRNA editing enzyme YbaK/EbsC (Cys-tRNA(Pro) deacylase)